jgi:hypothetical protein
MPDLLYWLLVRDILLRARLRAYVESNETVSVYDLEAYRGLEEHGDA